MATGPGDMEEMEKEKEGMAEMESTATGWAG